jgi:hypothetical protein
MRMSELAVDSDVMTERLDGHLEPAEVAAYVDRVADARARHRIEAHLASCPECRQELVDATRIAATLPRQHRLSMWIPAAAAAALVLMVVWPRLTREPTLEHREAPVTTTVAPRALSPVGAVDSAPALRWSSVPHTDRYQVRVYSADGAVLWERETTDTTVALPDSIGVRSSRTYHWKVEAYTGFDRRAASDLVEFSVRFPRR